MRVARKICISAALRGMFSGELDSLCGRKEAGGVAVAHFFHPHKALTTHYLTISVPTQSQKACQFVFGKKFPDLVTHLKVTTRY